MKVSKMWVTSATVQLQPVAVSSLMAGGWGPQQLATELIDDLRQVFLAALAPELSAASGASLQRFVALAEAMKLARVVRSIEILGHSVGGITYRHYAHRAPLAFKAIMTLPQPTAFSALIHGHDDECPCCRRPFADAG